MRQPADSNDAIALVRATVERVRADREHGASWLAREAAQALAQAISRLRMDVASAADGETREAVASLRAQARALAHARPSMAALATTVARIWSAGWPPLAPGDMSDTADTLRDALARAQEAAERLAGAWDSAAGAIADFAQPFLHGTVFTHSRSGTVERVLATLAQEPDRLARALVTESRPGGEGVATARALAAAGLRVTLVADAAVGLMASEATCVVLGADSIRADGSLVNKIGSYPLALAARAAGVPVYALCETLKVAPEDWPLTLEEMDPAELLPQPVAGIHVRNVYFDRTPAEYVTAIITEQGAMRPGAVLPLARQAAHELAALDAG